MKYDTQQPAMPLEEFRQIAAAGGPIVPGTPEKAAFEEWGARARWITNYMNCVTHSPEMVRRIFSELTMRDADDSLMLYPPFYTAVGVNLQTGSDVHIGQACHFGDHGGISIGSGCIIDDNVVITTISRDSQLVRRHNMYLSPVIIEDNVWIGAHTTVLPGVRIGEKAIVLAGSVVVYDVLPGTIFGGTPAQYLRDN